MFSIYANLMTINKTIIFLDNMIDEEINFNMFMDKIKFDINFLHDKFLELWNNDFKIVDNTDSNENYNYVKTYYFILRKFFRLLNKIKDNQKIFNDINFDNSKFNFIYDNVYEKIYSLSQQNKRFKFRNTEKQFINEEEYNLLLKFNEE